METLINNLNATQALASLEITPNTIAFLIAFVVIALLVGIPVYRISFQLGVIATNIEAMKNAINDINRQQTTDDYRIGQLEMKIKVLQDRVDNESI